MTTKPTPDAVPGLESCELKGAVAEAVIDDAKLARFNLDGLSLQPLEADEEREKLVRAGFIENAESQRATLRAEVTP